MWKKEDILKIRKVERIFKPEMNQTMRDRLYKTWLKAVERTKAWKEV
jgi:glycerol kinase